MITDNKVQIERVGTCTSLYNELNKELKEGEELIPEDSAPNEICYSSSTYWKGTRFIGVAPVALIENWKKIN